MADNEDNVNREDDANIQNDIEEPINLLDMPEREGLEFNLDVNYAHAHSNGGPPTRHRFPAPRENLVENPPDNQIPVPDLRNYVCYIFTGVLSLVVFLVIFIIYLSRNRLS